MFTYGVSDESANELYSEYHLGRRAFRSDELDNLMS